ncbi:MAG: hypothetical protein IT353_09700 [Gemmatimonadaceae bacterium]|nr:hypothetical protein [Gemmatimonadaceae bacterium]
METAEIDTRWDPEFVFPSFSTISNDGSEIVRVSVTDLKEAGEFFNVRRISAKGDTIFSTRIPYKGVPMPRAFIDSVLARGLGVDRDRTTPATRIPSVFPPVTGVYVEPNQGHTWITLRETATTFGVMVLNRSGLPVTTFKLPQKADLMAANATHLWLREKDADDIQSVTRYRLTCAAKLCR